jgi:cysteine-S-conjugate beta-lyase
MTFDFDRVIDRRNTNCDKWDRMGTALGLDAPDAIAMWVADMDFESPPAVHRDLRRAIDHGVFGYYGATTSWREACAQWVKRRHGWEIDPAWISITPGIVSALGLIVQALSEPGDEVIVFSPAYHAFRRIIEANGRKIHNVPMLTEQGRYRMDLDRAKAELTGRDRIVFLCSPHNPGGRVWEREELVAVARFCEENDLVLVSDEIHNDLVYPGATHIPTAIAAPFIASRLITCVAATKTFNLAGAHVGACVTQDGELRKKLDARIAACGLTGVDMFGMIATQAAWREGDEWLDALIPYLDGNRQLFDTGIARAVPGARSMPLQATYLAWVDFEGTGLSREDIMTRIVDRARIGVSPGPGFGPGGELHVRFNFATQRHLIREALSRLEEAFRD